MYAERKRRVWPVYYSEDSHNDRSKNAGRQSEKNVLLQEIEVKIEKITDMQRAITALNKLSDKQKIDNLDESDVEEFDEMLDVDVNNIDQVIEDLVDIDSEPVASTSSAMNQFSIDEIFSGQYSFTVDVSKSRIQLKLSCTCIIWNQISSINHISFQEWNERHYVHANITLRLVTVDTLKNWNKHNSSVVHDTKFIKWLLIEIFGSKILRAETLNTLDAEKLRFIRGLFYLLL